MRKLLRRRAGIFTLAAALTLAAAGCSRFPKPPTEGGELLIVAASFPSYDLARAVGGGRIEFDMLLPPAAESHAFEPTAQDILRISECDVFVRTGGESEAWADRLLDAADTSGVTVISLMDCVDAVTEELVEGMQAEHEDKAELDEHVWTSPRNVKII
ncbi:MAG: metal ABC transporter substrate-binding protein, partial [Oscillospiraceae bacterium]|nr:metal ABC transporter substrate-binding protein [Oscillospiraceae bacterium]